MIRRTTTRKSNGHAAPNGRPNGHSAAIAERDGVPEPASACPSLPAQAGSGRAAVLQPGLAASVDAGGSPNANSSAFPAAASMDRQTYAAAAPPPPHPESWDAPECRNARNAKEESQTATKQDLDNIPPGEAPLPSSPADFVEEVHRDTDLFKVWRSLLRSEDEKIRQRAVEKLTEMRYKGAAALADEPQRIIIDMPGPTRD